MHEVHVCGLSPATTYYYRVGGGAAGQEAWSDVHAFTTAPADAGTKVTIAVTGDSRGEANDAWRLVQSRVLAAAPTLQVFTGDMVDVAGDEAGWEHWLDSAWKDPHGNLSALGQVLTLSAHGNHENHNLLFFGNLVLPEDAQQFPKWTELFYSVNVGPVHLVVFDDAWIVGSGDPTFAPAFDAWLKADLDAAKASRGDRPWIVAAHHHAEYSSSTHGKDADVLQGRAHLAPLWDQYDVDLVLDGHDHDYERSQPLAGDPSSPTVGAKPGTTYVVNGGAGAPAYGNGTSAWTATSAGFDATAIGAYVLLAIDRSSLRITTHSLRADGSDPVIDDVTLTK